MIWKSIAFAVCTLAFWHIEQSNKRSMNDSCWFQVHQHTLRHVSNAINAIFFSHDVKKQNNYRKKSMWSIGCAHEIYSKRTIIFVCLYENHITSSSLSRFFFVLFCSVYSAKRMPLQNFCSWRRKTKIENHYIYLMFVSFWVSFFCRSFFLSWFYCSLNLCRNNTNS